MPNSTHEVPICAQNVVPNETIFNTKMRTIVSSATEDFENARNDFALTSRRSTSLTKTRLCRANCDPTT